MLGLLVFLFGLVPFALGIYAWRLLNRSGGPTPDDPPPPPPPEDPEPTAPTRPHRGRDRAPRHPYRRTRPPYRPVRF